MNGLHTVRTRSGIEIGRCYIRPAPREIGSEGERIQEVLLRHAQRVRDGAPWWVRVIRVFTGARAVRTLFSTTGFQSHE